MGGAPFPSIRGFARTLKLWARSGGWLTFSDDKLLLPGRRCKAGKSIAVSGRVEHKTRSFPSEPTAAVNPSLQLCAPARRNACCCFPFLFPERLFGTQQAPAVDDPVAQLHAVAQKQKTSLTCNANDLNQHDRRASPSGSQPSNQQKRWQKWLSPHPISCSACGAFIFWGYKGHNSNRHAAIVVWVKGPSQNYTFTKKKNVFLTVSTLLVQRSVSATHKIVITNNSIYFQNNIHVFMDNTHGCGPLILSNVCGKVISHSCVFYCLMNCVLC